MNNMHPDELYQQLYVNASSRKKRTLELIHEACKAQYDSDNKDFSLGTIARLIADKGGLTEQALRNKQAEDYRILINQWAEYSNTTTKKPKKQSYTTVNEELLAAISEPTTKALVGMIIAENKKLKSENHLLKSQTCITVDMRNTKDSYKSNNSDVIIVSPSFELTDMEVDALKEAILDSFFKEHGWTTDEQGRVKEKGFPVYKAGYVTAIKKVLREI